MKMLFVAPMPPPLTGNSLPVQVLYDAWKSKHDIEIVDLSKASHGTGVDSLARVLEVCGALWRVFWRQRRRQLVYLTVAESFAGNMRDLVCYAICWRRLNSVMIHMLGGAAMQRILSTNNGVQYRVNKYFLSRIGGVVVEGDTQRKTFLNVVAPDRIHVIPNFAQQELFETEAAVLANFRECDTLRVLFLSNMLPGKGHLELLRAYGTLDEVVRSRMELHFAGRMVEGDDREWFVSAMDESPNVRYHGTVSGATKKSLYASAHVFCLPTYYPYEGQPFCILEAYAAGCVVVTTNHSGIRNVFTDRVNGMEVEKRSVESLAAVLRRLHDERRTLCKIATGNVRQARNKYTVSAYLTSMTIALGKLGYHV